jgi:uncharacterized membrane protein
MSSEKAPTRRDHALLIGDGWLITAGTMSVAMALMFGLVAVTGSDGAAGIVVQLGSNVLLLAGGVGGVLLAWLLNGRRINAPTVVGGLVGSALGAVLVPIAAGLSFLLGLPLGLVTDWEFAGPVAMLVLLCTALLALTGWLILDAVRDMASAKREHYRLDLARIVAAAAFVLLAAVCVYLIFASPGPEQGEAFIWAMAGGAIGAGVIAGADLANVLTDRGSTPDATTGGAGSAGGSDFVL